MDSKYKDPRGIVSSSGGANDDYWHNALKGAAKSAVKDVSLYDKIRSIVDKNKKSNITVAEKVKEMQERAGVSKKRNIKTASKYKPILFEVLPETKSMIDTFLLNNEHLPDFPVIMDRILKKVRDIIKSRDDIEESAEFLTTHDEDLHRYIKDIIESKSDKRNSVELSLDVDDDVSEADISNNNDIFKSLTPNH